MNHLDIYKIVDADDFWAVRKDWYYPTEIKAIDTARSDRILGARRTDKDGNILPRVHAGQDFPVPVGTSLIAMTSGTVISVNDNFYLGTGAVAIRNNDGTIARYTEISFSVKNGDTITKGQVIGKVIAANNEDKTHMLHLEIYMGTEGYDLSKNPLTVPGNKTNYDYVPVKEYWRRSDLIDPTGATKLPLKQ